MAACFGSDTDLPLPHPVEYPAYVRVDVQCSAGRAKGQGPQKSDEGPQVAPGAAFGHGW